MPSASAVCARYHGRNSVITSTPYSSGIDSLSACVRWTIPTSNVIPNIKKAYTIFHASFCDLWHVTIGGQTLQESVRRFFVRIFSAYWVSNRHPQFQRQGVNKTPCYQNSRRKFSISLIHPAVFSGGIVRGLCRSREPLWAMLPKAVRR